MPLPALPAPPEGTFYRIDSTRVSHREYWWGTPSPAVVAGWLTKWLRVRLPSSADDPAVESLRPFEVVESGLPEEVRATFQPLLHEMASMGFQYPVFHWVEDAYHNTRMCLATLYHESGEALGRIHYRAWSFPRPPKVYLYCEFITPLADGSWLWSVASKPDLAAPPSMRVNRLQGAGAADLWASHRQALGSGAKPIRPVETRDALRDAIDHHHAVVRDFHLARGVFRPMTEDELRHADALRRRRIATAGSALAQHAEVLAEIDRLQERQSGWGKALLILAVSMAAFVGFGAARWNWEYVLLLIPVLLFHELGHYLAMRWFGYRNLRMFFIPLLGAAVSGRHYNVAGWKKVVVSLMGPVPGVFLGIGLGIAGIVLGNVLLVKVGLLTLILNGFNLLPVLPLDGGWVVHTLFFSRHYLLDVLFRSLAACALLAGSWFTGDRVLTFLGLFMLIGVFPAYKLAKIIQDVRRSGPPPASPDDQSIPPVVAQAIIDRVKAAFPRGITSRQVAQFTVQVFETLNARPPGWAGTISLASAHAAALGVAVLFLAAFLPGPLGRRPAFAQRMVERFAAAAADEGPMHVLDVKEMVAASTEEGPSATGPRATIVATYATDRAAARAFADASRGLPPGTRLHRFGQSLLLTLGPRAGGSDGSGDSAAGLGRPATPPVINQPGSLVPLTLECTAPDQAAAQAIEDEVRDYFAAPRRSGLVPPWQPAADDARTPEQRATHALARRTFRKLQEAGRALRLDDPVRDRLKKMRDAADRDDLAELDRQRVEHRTLLLNFRREKLRGIRNGAEGPVDEELADEYLRIVEACEAELFAAEEKALATDGRKPPRVFPVPRDSELIRRLAPRMGQVPMEAETAGSATRPQPSPGADRFATLSGSVGRQGRIIGLDWVMFPSLGDGAPALAWWLHGRGCRDFRYDFQHPFPTRPLDRDDTDETLGEDRQE